MNEKISILDGKIAKTFQRKVIQLKSMVKPLNFKIMKKETDFSITTLHF